MAGFTRYRRTCNEVGDDTGAEGALHGVFHRLFANKVFEDVNLPAEVSLAESHLDLQGDDYRTEGLDAVRNPERWDKIIWAADRIWASTDNMWKVSRWFGLGFVALAANEVTSDVPVGLFGLVASAIGLLSLGAWFFRAQADGLTRRSIGPFQTAVVTLLVLAISTYLATALWSLLRFMAYPVLVG